MKIIAYYRVSTDKQRRSGLGLEAQKAAIVAFSDSAGGSILQTYTEIESGRKCDRLELQKALNHARQADATLVVAKLDRLARNVAFLSALMEAGVPFICCDNPNATPLTIHILAAIAEDEAKRISRRTKEALSALKARGVKLGAANPVVYEKLKGKRGWKKGTEQSKLMRARMQRERYGSLLPLMRELRDLGKSYPYIAAALNRQGYVTTRGRPFCPSQVMRVLDREAELV